MVYSNKFVMCVLVNGHVLKELANGVVPIPFGAEYTLRFRNKNSRRAVVKIYIDGENISGGGYVINANDSVDIRRHHDVDRSFKFVALDSEEAHEHGKNGPNADKVKGTIEARFYLEKEVVREVVNEIHHDHHHHHHHDHWKYIQPYRPSPWVTYGSTSTGLTSNDMYRASNDAPQAKGSRLLRSRSLRGPSGSSAQSGLEGTVGPCSLSAGSNYAAGPSSGPSVESTMGFVSERSRELKDGCTVEGNTTGQSFYTISVDLEDTYTTLKVFLQGHTEDQAVAAETPQKRPTSKDKRLEDLEAENEALRLKLAEAENEKLKKELEKKSKNTRKPSRRKTKAE